MRIIAGEWRGRKLAAPKGDGTRPTTDRVRESLMSSLSSALGGFDGVVVLDAFAGSGALGFEALSRGARSATFVEADARAFRTVEANAKTLGLSRPRACLLRGDVLARPPRQAAAPFDLVLLDPPYATDPTLVFAMLDALDASGSLAACALVSYEHAKATDLTPFAQAASVSWQAVSRKVYGETAIDFLRRECS